MSINLNTLEKGKNAQIISLDSFQDSNRLKALGFVPGKILSIKNSNNPMVVNICGSSICIDNKIAEKIKVNPQ